MNSKYQQMQSREVPALAEEHGESIVAELALERGGENAAFVEDFGWGVTGEVVRLEKTQVIHVDVLLFHNLHLLDCTGGQCAD